MSAFHRFEEFARDQDKRWSRKSARQERPAAPALEQCRDHSTSGGAEAQEEAISGNTETADGGKGCGMLLLAALVVSVIVGAMRENRELRLRIAALEANQQGRSNVLQLSED